MGFGARSGAIGELVIPGWSLQVHGVDLVQRVVHGRAGGVWFLLENRKWRGGVRAVEVSVSTRYCAREKQFNPPIDRISIDVQARLRTG